MLSSEAFEAWCKGIGIAPYVAGAKGSFPLLPLLGTLGRAGSYVDHFRRERFLRNLLK